MKEGNKKDTVFYLILNGIMSIVYYWIIVEAKEEGLKELIEAGFRCLSAQIGLFGWMYFMRKLGL